METIVVHVDPEIRELIPDFLAHRRQDVSSLIAALAGADFDEIYRIGHSLKGVGGGFGFDEISEIGRGIERAAKARLAEPVEAGIEELRRYLERIEVVFDEESV